MHHNREGMNRQKAMASAALCACFVTLLVLTLTTAATGPQVTVITGATVIDGTGRAPIRGGVVVIEGDRIKTVGRAGKVKWPRDAQVVEAAGMYVVPGLIDMHTHYREWQGELFLAHGITSVKDLGNPVEWISALSRMQVAGQLRGPRLFFVGNNLDASPPEGDHHIGIANSSDIERAVRLLHQLGVTAIKVRHKVTPDQLAEITKAAHALDLPVTGHLGKTDAMEAAQSGLDGLEHATGVARAASKTPEQVKTDAKGLAVFLEDLRGFSLMDKAKETALIKKLVEKRVALIPTLAVRRRILLDTELARQEDSRYARDPSLAYVPESVRQHWIEAPVEQKILEAFRGAEMDMMRKGYRRLERFVREFHRAGGLVLAGSDNLNGVPGITLHRELESLVAAGLEPYHALRAATHSAARFLNRRDLGSIEPGQIADMLVVRANPLDNIRHLREIEKVFQGGQLIEIRFQPDYALPPSRPQLVRPLYLERLLAESN